MWLLVIYRSSFKEINIQIVCPFFYLGYFLFVCLFCFCHLTGVRNLLCVLNINHLYFLPYLELFSILLMVSFYAQSFKFWWSQIYLFFLLCCSWLCVISENIAKPKVTKMTTCLAFTTLILFLVFGLSPSVLNLCVRNYVSITSPLVIKTTAVYRMKKVFLG